MTGNPPARQLTFDAVKHYYGEVLKSSADLQTSACCLADPLPAWLRPMLADIHPEVRERFYGCGSPLPAALEGATVLDLGCGSGRDCYLLARLVGPGGKVIGLDMTDAQLEVARRHLDYHADQRGYANVEFRKGYIENLLDAGIADASIDVVISNCVINLSPDKQAVFAEIFRVLKPGGELFFSDVFADRRVPAALAQDPLLLGECLGGALYREDFRRLMAAVGCPDVRVLASTPLALFNEAIAARVGNIGFHSMTVRAFKLALEDRCEDYGEVATYLGTLAHHPHAYELDDHHRFETGRPMLVCSNSADMLARTRFAPHFRISGDRSTHFGLFDCGPVAAVGSPAGAACC
ncbi:methyltransferase domain-containing protein [Nevskia sp.]|uniref:methyltransferase domain-containing protein n=1 Tax=Nevskia sp. TaxID=1929292 RepID=UPI0025F201FC|nr:methyltransferase domain-containing protein [Nevskia sp.]